MAKLVIRKWNIKKGKSKKNKNKSSGTRTIKNEQRKTLCFGVIHNQKMGQSNFWRDGARKKASRDRNEAWMRKTKSMVTMFFSKLLIARTSFTTECDRWYPTGCPSHSWPRFCLLMFTCFHSLATCLLIFSIPSTSFFSAHHIVHAFFSFTKKRWKVTVFEKLKEIICFSNFGLSHNIFFSLNIHLFSSFFFLLIQKRSIRYRVEKRFPYTLFGYLFP